MHLRSVLVSVALGCATTVAYSAGAGPYRLVQTAKVGGAGGFDYVFADVAGRNLYIPRGDRVTVFDLDSLAPKGVIADAKGARGAIVAPGLNHGFSSSNPVLMWDTRTLETLKSIPVQGSPDGIFFEPATQRVYVLSHRVPNVTVIDPKDGAIVGTFDLGGAPEQAASDGRGRVYINLEDKDQVAVVDPVAMKLVTQYDLAGKGGGPAGLALDAQNGVLFACCRDPATCVIMSAADGKILATLPIGAGTDGAIFNPATMEAYSSNRDGTLTVIKETSPTTFTVTQNVATKTGAKTCTLDSKTQRILLISAEYGPPAAASSGGTSGGKKKKGGGRGALVPDSFSILVVAR